MICGNGVSGPDPSHPCNSSSSDLQENRQIKKTHGCHLNFFNPFWKLQCLSVTLRLPRARTPHLKKSSCGTVCTQAPHFHPSQEAVAQGKLRVCLCLLSCCSA